MHKNTYTELYKEVVSVSLLPTHLTYDGLQQKSHPTTWPVSSAVSLYLHVNVFSS